MSDRTYFLRPGERRWHGWNGSALNWRALCGRLPTRWSEVVDGDLPADASLCALCRDVAAITVREDAEIAAEEARQAEDMAS